MGNRYPFALIKEQLAQRKDKAIDFAIGRRSIPLPDDIQEWVHSHLELALEACNHADMDAFADAAVAYLAREYRLPVSSAQILPTASGRVAMGAFIACVLNPGDTVVVTEPGYPAFARLAAHRHARVVRVPLDPRKGFAPDFSAVPAVGDQPVRVVSLNYPNNPTGAKLSRDLVDGLGDVVSPETVIFNDATYGPLVYDEAPTALMNTGPANGISADILELHSFSKLFPLGPGAVSFLAGSLHIMEKLKTYSEFAWSPLSRLQLKATAICLQNAQRLRELRQFFPSRLADLNVTLVDLGFRPCASPSGVYVLCAAPTHVNGQPVSSAAETARWLMDEFDLAVVPLDTAWHRYLRFAALYTDHDLERLAALRDRVATALASGGDDGGAGQGQNVATPGR